MSRKKAGKQTNQVVKAADICPLLNVKCPRFALLQQVCSEDACYLIAVKKEGVVTDV